MWFKNKSRDFKLEPVVSKTFCSIVFLNSSQGKNCCYFQKTKQTVKVGGGGGALSEGCLDSREGCLKSREAENRWFVPSVCLLVFG